MGMIDFGRKKPLKVKKTTVGDVKDYYVALVVDTPVKTSLDSVLGDGFKIENGKVIYTKGKK